VLNRANHLLLGAALAALSIASFGAAVSHAALFTYAAATGVFLVACGHLVDVTLTLRGQQRPHRPVFSVRWNVVLTATDLIFASLILARLLWDLRVPQPVYGLGAAALALSMVRHLLPALRG
jgi:hypothetical protein